MSQARLVDRIPPIVWFVACLLAGAALDRGFPFPLGVRTVRLLVGLTLLGGAAVVGPWSLSWFRRARTTFVPFGSPTALLTNGPYRFSRNPLYVCLLATQGTIGLLADNGWIVLWTPALWWALDRLVIPGEEATLHNRFGEQYAAYAACVRRWL